MVLEEMIEVYLALQKDRIFTIDSYVDSAISLFLNDSLAGSFIGAARGNTPSF